MRAHLLSVLLLLSSSLSYAATFTVTSNADAGAGTLRQAILDANANGGADVINFNFGGATTITLTSCLPNIDDPLTIDGYSDPAASAGNLTVHVYQSANCIVLRLVSGADNSTIRGLVISGGQDGIFSDGVNDITVSGNYIGTNMAGTAAAADPPTSDGIELRNGDNFIVGGNGGLIDRNLFGGNMGAGISLYNSNGAVIQGNVIGMSADGTAMIGNGGSGMHISLCPGIQIGGLTANERNYSSCNNSFGMHLDQSPNAVIEGNWIGVDMATGNLDFGNRDAGIEVITSTDVRIGGSVAGAGNITSGNGTGGNGADGISHWQNSHRAIIKGNIIGLGTDGTTLLPNDAHGIELLTSDDAIIGGASALERNLVAGSMNQGMQIVTCPRIQIINNYVGTDVSGTLDRGGLQNGISITHSPDAVVGGPTAAERNVICGNNQRGIFVSGNSNGALIQNNYIGVGADGTTPIGNSINGIDIDAADNHEIWDNVVSNNGDIGIKLANSTDNTIYRNYVGVTATGTGDAGNNGPGMRFGATSTDNEVGGSLANANRVAYNGNRGFILESQAQRIEITFNRIWCNTSLGIDLESVANESVPAPVITSSTANTVSGTGSNGMTIHVYRNVTGDGGADCDCEGEIYVGMTTVDGSGNWSLTHNLGLSGAQASAVTATQTTTNNSTSEFSNCTPPLPVELLVFDGWNEGDHNHIVWTTAQEINNDYFILERSLDGVNFNAIATINGAGTYSGILDYSHDDYNISSGVYYYRLKQVDFDGTFAYSNVIAIKLGGGTLEIKNIYPHPVSESFQFGLNGISGEDVVVEILDVLGKVHYKTSEAITSGAEIIHIAVPNDLPAGTYVLRVSTASGPSAVFKNIVISR